MRGAERLPGGDGLRAVAALLVFVHHASFLTGTTFNSSAGALFARFDVGVSVFFALSGFLLARPYVAAILDGEPLPDIGRFYRRRVLRIVPAYWVALTATYVWLRPESATQADWVDRVLHYLFLQIYPADTFAKGISPAWTLAVEMSFYVALPWLAVAGARLVRSATGPNRRALLLLGGLVGLFAVSVLWRCAAFAGALPDQAVLWLPGTIDLFAAGMAFAVLSCWAARRSVARAATDALGRYDLLWWLIAAGLLALASNQLGLARGLESASWNRELWRQLVYLLVAACLLAPVAFGPQDRGIVRRFLRSWPLATIGVVSYGLFLWHVPLIETAIERTDRAVFLDWSRGLSVFSADVLVPTALALALSLVAATASWFLVERPLIQRWRK